MSLAKWHKIRLAQLDLPQMTKSTRGEAIIVDPKLFAGWPTMPYGRASGASSSGLAMVNKHIPKVRQSAVAAHEEMHLLLGNIEQEHGAVVKSLLLNRLKEKLAPVVISTLTKSLIKMGYDESHPHFLDEMILYCHTYLTDPKAHKIVNDQLGSVSMATAFQKSAEESWAKVINYAANVATSDFVINGEPLFKDEEARKKQFMGMINNDPKRAHAAALAALVQDPALEVRMALARNSNLDISHQMTLARDSDKSVRRELDLNPNTPPEVSRILEASRRNLAASESNYLDSLQKAVPAKDWARIERSHSDDNSLMVDHKPHMAQAPAPKVFKDMLASPKKFTAEKGIANGISAKMIQNIPATSSQDWPSRGLYMSKPYHKKIESATRSWVKHPILGWATMATKALFNAGQIGHLCEDVSVHEHEGKPLTVHKFVKDHQTIADLGMYHSLKADSLQVHQIAVMDYLSNNMDRHGGNLLVSDHAKDGKHPLLAIDHERSFQYVKPLADSWRGAELEPESNQESPYNYIKASALEDAFKATDAAKYREHDHAPVAQWWKDNSHNIKDEMEKQLKSINDPSVRDHVRNNFMDRANAMDQWVKRHEETGDTYTGNDMHNLPHVRIRKLQVPRLQVNRLIEKLPNDPKQAIDTLVTEINGRKSITPKQLHLMDSAMSGIISKLNPKELTELYNHALHNPHYNSAKVKNTANPRTLIHKFLKEPSTYQSNAPVYRDEHIKEFIDYIDQLPEAKRPLFLKDELRGILDRQGAQ